MGTIIQGIPLKSGNQPKKFIAKIYQVDNDAPQMAVLINTLGLEIEFNREGVGSYAATFNKELHLIQTTVSFTTNIGDDSSGIVTIQNFSGANLQFRTFALYNGLPPQLRDNMLCGTTLEIAEFL